MKLLINNIDKEMNFDDIEKAKKYFDIEDCYKGEELDKDYKEYLNKIRNASTLNELAEVLNHYTDKFDNGSQYTVKEL